MASTRQHAGARDLRVNSTDAERRLWRALRSAAFGAKFRRQHPIPPHVADFACIEAALVIEVDGGQHGPERDGARDVAMQAAGWHVARCWNNDVLQNTEGVLLDINRLLSGRGKRRLRRTV